MKLKSDETQLTGNWLKEENHIIGDDVCQRIELLLESHLKYLATDWSGWEKLYLDPDDNRLWEHTYPRSEMHGGGPPQLRIISTQEAFYKYQIKIE